VGEREFARVRRVSVACEASQAQKRESKIRRASKSRRFPDFPKRVARFGISGRVTRKKLSVPGGISSKGFRESECRNEFCVGLDFGYGGVAVVVS
jgi:hypothetical protein